MFNTFSISHYDMALSENYMSRDKRHFGAVFDGEVFGREMAIIISLGLLIEPNNEH